MKFLLLILIGLLAVPAARADYFEKSPSARLDLQLDDADAPLYFLTIWRGLGESTITAGGELQKMGKSGYRAVPGEGESAALLNLTREGENWRLAYAKDAGERPDDADQIEGVYLPVSLKVACAHSQARFEDLDALLNSNYQTVRAAVTPERAAELRGLQRDWIAYRDRMAQAQPAQVGENQVPFDQAPSYWDMMADLTTDRLAFLKAWNGAVASTGMVGDYRDFFGGGMILTDAPGGFAFQINVVRGPSANSGEISGSAQLNQTKTQASYSDGENPPAKLQWAFQPDGSVVVSEENTGAYGGAGAHFSGHYYKTSEASTEAN